MNFNHPSTELLFTTVQIQTTKINGSGYGTGFIISIPADNKKNIPILITNYHVIKGVEKIYADFFEMDSENNFPITNKPVHIEIDFSLFYSNEALDVTFVPIAPILGLLSQKNKSIFYRSIDKNIVYLPDRESELAAIEEITFIGYPYGLKEKSNNLPIIRRGITATPVWSDKDTFLIDAGVFPGSSGSPVFIYNQGSYSNGKNTVIGSRLIFLGMIKTSLQNNNEKQFIGLGEVIKANTIFKFIEDELRSKITN